MDSEWLQKLESPNIQSAPNFLIHKILGSSAIKEGSLVGRFLHCMELERHAHCFNSSNILSVNLISSSRCNHSLRTFQKPFWLIKASMTLSHSCMLILCNLVINSFLSWEVALLSKLLLSPCFTCASLMIGHMKDILNELFPLPPVGQFLFKCLCLLHKRQQPLEHCLSFISWSDPF